MPVMNRWNIEGDPATLFKEADADGKGMILFIEFCQWAIKKNLDLDTDDDLLWKCKQSYSNIIIDDKYSPKTDKVPQWQ